MGAVYLGVRDDAFQKRVAIKVLKRGMDSESIVRRFRNERQILASLEHPFIAGLLDGGTTPDGRPFFAMEYIEGQPIADYCESRSLDTTARLELFRNVCAAQNDLAIGHAKMAELIDALGDTAKALPKQQRALDLHRRLSVDDPGSNDMKGELASDYNRLATLQAKLGMRVAGVGQSRTSDPAQPRVERRGSGGFVSEVRRRQRTHRSR